MFSADPIIESLNSEPFDRIVSTTWFIDNPSMNFSSAVRFGDVVLHKPITAKLLNGLSLESINDRYLSLTKPQSVSTSIRFQNSVQFTNNFQTNSISLNGQLKLYQR